MDKQRNPAVFRQQMNSYIRHRNNNSNVTNLVDVDRPIHP